jgi:hypothetical protein
VDRTLLVRGRIGSTCQIPPGGNVLVYGSCSLTLYGGPLIWISDGTESTYNFDRSLGIVWTWHSPPAASPHIQGERVAVYAAYLRSAAPCSEELGPPRCIVVVVNWGR